MKKNIESFTEVFGLNVVASVVAVVFLSSPKISSTVISLVIALPPGSNGPMNCLIVSVTLALAFTNGI